MEIPVGGRFAALIADIAFEARGARLTSRCLLVTISWRL
jgi:hypothetical protein